MSLVSKYSKMSKIHNYVLLSTKDLIQVTNPNCSSRTVTSVLVVTRKIIISSSFIARDSSSKNDELIFYSSVLSYQAGNLFTISTFILFLLSSLYANASRSKGNEKPSSNRTSFADTGYRVNPVRRKSSRQREVRRLERARILVADDNHRTSTTTTTERCTFISNSSAGVESLIYSTSFTFTCHDSAPSSSSRNPAHFSRSRTREAATFSPAFVLISLTAVCISICSFDRVAP